MLMNLVYPSFRFSGYKLSLVLFPLHPISGISSKQTQVIIAFQHEILLERVLSCCLNLTTLPFSYLETFIGHVFHERLWGIFIVERPGNRKNINRLRTQRS